MIKDNNELIPTDLPEEAFKTAIDAIIKEKPEFKELNLVQLKDNDEFQQMLKKYITVNSPIQANPQTSDIEILKSVIPKTFSISNNKLSNEMTRDIVNKGEIPLAVINVGNKNEIFTYNSLTYEGENISITGRYEFTAYDRTIHNAVCSLYAAGNDVVTPAMVYRAVTGMIETEYVSPQAIEAVKNSLNKSRFMRLVVDFTEEARARGWNIDKTTIESYLLPAKLVKVEAGGNKIEAYKILETPELYKYSQLTKQIISIPLALLDTKEATRNTEEIIPIKEYLIRRIEIMRHDRSMNNKIVYNTIFEETGIITNHKTERNRYKKYIKEILSLWQTRDNYIKEYKEYKDGTSTKGIEIYF